MSNQTTTPHQKSVIDFSRPMRGWVIGSLIGILVLLVAFLAIDISNRSDWIVWGIMAVAIVGALVPAFWGLLLPGRLIAPISFIFALLYITYTGGGVTEVTLIGAAIAILMAGLFWGNWGAFLSGLLLTLGVLSLGLIRIWSQEQISTADRPAYVDIIIATVMLVITTSCVTIANNFYHRKIMQLQQERDTFEILNQELQDNQGVLEMSFNERSRQLSRRAQQLQAAAEVSRAVASLRDINELLGRVTQLISEQFGYYHVGVFLLDPVGENAVLRAANSTGGQRMLIRKHTLPVGSRSIVGYTTAQSRPRIAMDVGQDAVYFDNPDLPETRSEMALPLIVGGKLLGALDVQSVEENAFTQDDIEVLQVLADQVAIAIENSNLFAESQLALEASQRAYGELSRQAWLNLLLGRHNFGYRMDSRGNIHPIEGGWSDELLGALRAGKVIKLDEKTLAVPIKVLDLPAGIVKLRKHSDGRPWTDREIRLIENIIAHLGDALESARLYEDSQRRAERERITGDIAARIRESLDVDTVLQTAVIEMRRALNLEEITIRLGESNGQSDS